MPDKEVVEAPTQVDPDIERQAKGMGWVPKDKFRGDASKWRPADEYVQRAEEFPQIAKSVIRRYKDTIKRYQQENGAALIQGKKERS